MSTSKFAEEADSVTSRIVPLLPPTAFGDEIKMFSFHRPAVLFWRKLYEILREQGCTEEEIISWFQSKSPRQYFDQNQDIFDVVAAMVSVIAKNDIEETRV